MVQRIPNTTKEGYAWKPETILAVWSKGRVIPNFSPAVWRWDKCGRVMKFSEHGNRQSEYGWEIDHILAVANGGSDELSNLQPLNWAMNVNKSDNLFWSCPLPN
jgi:5-methylcytosine-specific restriction endonuclease McrA